MCDEPQKVALPCLSWANKCSITAGQIGYSVNANILWVLNG